MQKGSIDGSTWVTDPTEAEARVEDWREIIEMSIALRPPVAGERRGA